MKKLSAPLVISLALVLTGCGRMSVAELSEKKIECEAAGGKFRNWEHEFGSNWRCDLTTEEK